MEAPELHTYIFKSLENVWTNKLLCDVTVKVQDDTFECHRLLLAVASDFFMALFRSGMKEVTENFVVLHDIPSEAFHLILKGLYTGANVLSAENYIDVWRAAHQLQIQTVIHLCEHFASKNITADTWETIFTVAKSLQSERVLAKLQEYMINNFNEVCISPIFLQFTFEDLRDLIKSQDLVVSSEDLVMESVIRWVNYDPKVKNERKEGTKELHEDTSTKEKQGKNVMLDKIGSRKVYLNKLLRKVRTCLVSPLVLSSIRKMDLLLEDRDSRDIIGYAISYNAEDFRHCQCPSAALTRSGSGYMHAGVYLGRLGRFRAINASSEKSYILSCSHYFDGGIQIVTFDGTLYLAGELSYRRNGCNLYVLTGKNCTQVKDLSCHNVLLVSHGDFIYILNKDEKVVYRMNPNKESMPLEKFTEFPENNNSVMHTMFLQNVLLLFCSETQNGIDKTAVYKMEISSKIWTRLTNLDGPAKQLISFKNDKHYYILQTNGSLWLVLYSSHTGNIGFKFLVKLWNFTKKLYGGFTFQSKLIICGNKLDTDPTQEKKLSEVPHHFKCIRYLGADDENVSNFIPVTIPKAYILYETRW
ncbi:uncharacterized protein LOC131951707 [Physella acuta]|uniref:uncharacterized protein LOC131951707 n=1 Tax=Physella acuta TaxID=109671 RepID=UPI0027DAD063|nr:uncharacterized protein LOC131951707 [Physella acuta]